MYEKMHKISKKMGIIMIKRLKLWGFTNLLCKFHNFWPFWAFGVRFCVLKILKIYLLDQFPMYEKMHKILRKMAIIMIKRLKLWGFTNLLWKFHNFWPFWSFESVFAYWKYWKFSFWIHLRCMKKCIKFWKKWA